ncbi:MAG: HupE/UreJ family protein [Chlorobiota bacterium]|nr:HupE/UreJ family protein [Chlorobiota bacterium]QQS66508.1 MAG: HupE/UreJ family protein [Chlorobiota bacterium]
MNFQLFLKLGFYHILEGYDHLLFLIGLIIVADKWKNLLTIISAFTITHSTTLILSALGILSLPPILTESLIAASICYVGIENVISGNKNKRWLVAGLFGLIHGAGFSGHLTDLLKTMLNGSELWSTLMGFNIGIELGQLLVIIAVFPIIFLLRKFISSKIIYNNLINELSRVIAAIGAILLIFRIWEIK